MAISCVSPQVPKLNLYGFPCQHKENKLIVQGICVAPKTCHAVSYIDESGRVCTFDSSNKAVCDSRGAEGRKLYDKLQKELDDPLRGAYSPIPQTTIDNLDAYSRNLQTVQDALGRPLTGEEDAVVAAFSGVGTLEDNRLISGGVGTGGFSDAQQRVVKILESSGSISGFTEVPIPAGSLPESSALSGAYNESGGFLAEKQGLSEALQSAQTSGNTSAIATAQTNLDNFYTKYNIDPVTAGQGIQVAGSDPNSAFNAALGGKGQVSSPATWGQQAGPGTGPVVRPPDYQPPYSGGPVTGGPIAGTQPAPQPGQQQPTFPQPQPQYPTYSGGFFGGGGGGILSGIAGFIGDIFNPQPAPEPQPVPVYNSSQSINQIVYLSQLVVPDISTTINTQQTVYQTDPAGTVSPKSTNIPVTDFNRITFLEGQASTISSDGSVDDVIAKIRAFAGITETGSGSQVGRAGRLGTEAPGAVSAPAGSPAGATLPAAGPLGNSYALDAALLTGGGQPWSAIRGRAPAAITFTPYEPLAVSAINAPEGSPASAFDRSIIAYNSGWITSQRELLQARLALEQARSNFEIAKAAISAWQQVEEVGLCGETCRLSLETLQSQMPAREARVKALEDIVSRGISAVPQIATFGADRQASIFGPDSPLQGIEDIAQLQPDTQGGTASGTTGDASAGETSVTDIPQTQPATTSAAPAPRADARAPQAAGTLPDVLTRVAGVFTALFEEPTPSAAPTCSLLSSLFGGCEGW
ncbi:MAG: hypothetical protein NUV59_03445 [Patescibacteria group bacterium]|nr:hypothetical protein [Patescibacteria group bacterium]